MMRIRKTRRSGLYLLLLTGLASLVGDVRAGEIKHKFLATDESRKQLLYVDETDPEKSTELENKVKMLGFDELLSDIGILG